MDGADDGGRQAGLRALLRRVKGAIRRRRGRRHTGELATAPRATVVAANHSSTPAAVEDGEAVLREETSANADATTARGEEPLTSAVTSTIAQPQQGAIATPATHEPALPTDPEDDIRPTSSNAEFSLPIPLVRTAFTPDRARAMFEKHGVTYEPIAASLMSRGGLQRVERPIRVRLHWQCHQCHTQFGPTGGCTGCGHRRCDDCSRGPAKKVREALANAAIQQEHRESRTTTGPAAAIGVATPRHNPTTQVTRPEVLEVRSAEDMTSDDDYPSDPISLILQSQRPVSARELVSDTNRPTTRRTCHECRTPIAAINPTQCQHCSHNVCSFCPREPIRRDQWAYDSPSPHPEAPKMVATVQRVYRKPRQRIRWTCHECSVMFMDKKECRGCGHGRCQDCPRTPAKKVVPPPDPSALQSVNDRLARLAVRQPLIAT